MDHLLSLVVGVLLASGFYMLLRRSLVRLIIGLVLLSQGANLFLFTVGGMVRGQPPIVAHAAKALPQPVSDPLPQALILTAIVIGFGLQAFAVVLLRRVLTSTGKEDLDQLDRSEERTW